MLLNRQLKVYAEQTKSLGKKRHFNHDLFFFKRQLLSCLKDLIHKTYAWESMNQQNIVSFSKKKKVKIINDI